MIEEAERTGDARTVVKNILDSKEKLMGFGHRVYRAEDPRARVLRATAKRLAAPRYEVAAALEQAALAELRERRPDRAIETNVEFWAAVILDFAKVPAKMMPAMFTCGRTAGWCAHILEQKRWASSCGRRRSTSGRNRAQRNRSRAGTRSPTRPASRRSAHDPNAEPRSRSRYVSALLRRKKT